MPYLYCSECARELKDWREAYDECPHCGICNLSLPEAFEELSDECKTLREELDDALEKLGAASKNIETLFKVMKNKTI